MANRDIRQRVAATAAGPSPPADHLSTKLHHVRDSKVDDDNSLSFSGFGLLLTLTLITAVAVPILLFTLFVVYSSSTATPVSYSMPSPPPLVGPLKPNTHLLLAEKLYEGRVHGPESIVIDHGHIYTGTSDGQVVHIYKGEIKTIARLGKPPCDGYDSEPTCGRPLGMRLDNDGYLIVADAYFGLFKINVVTGDVHLLLPSSVNINGRTLVLVNDLDISDNGDIFFTDTSRYQRRDYFADLIDGRGTGRLLKYDPLHNTTEILLEGLRFANGVQLSKYEDFVLVCETFQAQVVRYYLRGINAGQTDVFVDNLPCLPDNIRRSARGGYWIACINARYDGNVFNAVDVLASTPWLRWILSKLPQSFVMWFIKLNSMLIELDSQGNIIRALMDLNGQNLRLSSEVADDAGTLYIGSFQDSYIARIDTHRLPHDINA